MNSTAMYVTREQLRTAIAKALVNINVDVLQALTPAEKLTMNKFALRLIRNILTELHIDDWKEF